jgi:hypothetical protein
LSRSTPPSSCGSTSRVGSVEAGKDADLVVWSGDPLAITSRVEQTWIDGRRYFDREDDRQMQRHRDAAARNRLVQKILGSGEAMAADGENDREADESELWPRADLFCHGHGHGHAPVTRCSASGRAGSRLKRRKDIFVE